MSKLLVVLMCFCAFSVFAQDIQMPMFSAQNIKGEIINFDQSINRIYILSSSSDCSECKSNVVKLISSIREKLVDSVKIIFVSNNYYQNVLKKRNIISENMKRYKNVDQFLFNYADNPSCLKNEGYKFGETPILFVQKKNTNDYLKLSHYDDQLELKIIQFLN